MSEDRDSWSTGTEGMSSIRCRKDDFSDKVWNEKVSKAAWCRISCSSVHRVHEQAHADIDGSIVQPKRKRVYEKW